MTSHERLTGRTRHRVTGWSGLLVLQVEVERDVASYDGGGYVDIDKYIIWRDARATDLTTKPAPIDYQAKCNRRRDDGPTPCLCCNGPCVG